MAQAEAAAGRSKASRAATASRRSSHRLTTAASRPGEPLQGDRLDRRADHGQPRARLCARHDRLAACWARATPTTPSTSPSCCPTSSAGCSRKAPSRQGFVPLFSRRLAVGRASRKRRRFANEMLAVFMPALLLVTIVFEIFMPGVVWLVASDYARRPGQVRAGGRADPLDLPLSDVHQPGGAVVGRAQLADPLRGRGLRPGPAQHRADRRAAGRAAGQGRDVRYMAIAVLVGGVAPVRAVLGRGAPRRRQAALRPAADDAGGARTGRPDPAGDARRPASIRSASCSTPISRPGSARAR